MSSKKMITVTPELFNISGKTRKRREKKEISFNPIITPNNLKNKLLKRIKEHKMNEINQKTNLDETSKTSNFSDEFYNAVNYLSELKNKQKQQRILHNRTIRNFSSSQNQNQIQNQIQNQGQSQNNNFMSELNDSYNSIIPSDENNILKMNYQLVDNVPYGCLKNGKKKTYRQWQEEIKFEETPGLKDILNARPPTPPKKNAFGIESKLEPSVNNIFTNSTNKLTNQNENENTITKEQRLENIRNKLRQLEDNEAYTREKSLKELEQIEYQMGFKNEPEIPDIDSIGESTYSIDDIINSTKSIPNKNYIKRTIKRRFTLGKSDKLKKVAILIKDKQTRRKVLNTQKELKNTSITDIKRYLRQHGIIKTGTTCPTDILRKMYESALMAGEITNINKDTLLHNFLNPQ